MSSQFFSKLKHEIHTKHYYNKASQKNTIGMLIKKKSIWKFLNVYFDDIIQDAYSNSIEKPIHRLVQ